MKVSAPVIVRNRANSERHQSPGITTIIVEQNAVAALKLANRAVILDWARWFYGGAKELLDNPDLRDEYSQFETCWNTEFVGVDPMSRSSIHRVKPEWREGAHIDAETYEAGYRASIENRTSSGDSTAGEFIGLSNTPRSKNIFDGNVSIKWFEDGVTNVAYNCIDRHLETRADQTAILWEGDNPAEDKRSPIASFMRTYAGSPMP